METGNHQYGCKADKNRDFAVDTGTAYSINAIIDCIGRACQREIMAECSADSETQYCNGCVCIAFARKNQLPQRTASL